MTLNLKLPKLFGRDDRAAGVGRLDMLTTQLRTAALPSSYDPLASVSVIEQLRTATDEAKMPRKVPLIGRLPTVKQFQVLAA